MPKSYLNPPDLFPSEQYGFSQAIAASGTTRVYVSGQVAWDAHKKIGDRGDLRSQIKRTLANLDRALRAAGGKPTDIVALRIYLVGEHIHNSHPVREALLGFFPSETRPTSTWIGVSALANPDFLVEIEATAELE